MVRSELDHNFYLLIKEGKYIIGILYIDDLLAMGNNIEIGIKFIYSPICILFSQQKYTHKIIVRFGMENCHHVATLMEGQQLRFDMSI
jgi:hypothetical protein